MGHSTFDSLLNFAKRIPHINCEKVLTLFCLTPCTLSTCYEFVQLFRHGLDAGERSVVIRPPIVKISDRTDKHTQNTTSIIYILGMKPMSLQFAYCGKLLISLHCLFQCTIAKWYNHSSTKSNCLYNLLYGFKGLMVMPSSLDCYSKYM